MKKAFKVFAILVGIIWVFIISLLIVTMTRQEKIGNFMLNSYEEVTSDYTMTVEEMYALLAQKLIVACIVVFIATLIIVVVGVIIYKLNTTESESEKKETEMKQEKEKKQLAIKFPKKEKKEKVVETPDVPVATAQPVKGAHDKAASDFLDSLKKKNR